MYKIQYGIKIKRQERISLVSTKLIHLRKWSEENFTEGLIVYIGSQFCIQVTVRQNEEY